MSQIIESKEERRLRLNREGQRRYRLRYPDRIKEIQKRCYDKLRKDPERVENYRSYHREWIKNARLEDLAYRIGKTPYGGRKIVPIEICRDLIERENGLCQHRDKNPCKSSLGTHHIDGNPENTELSNLMLLCMGHHTSLENNLFPKRSVKK